MQCTVGLFELYARISNMQIMNTNKNKDNHNNNSFVWLITPYNPGTLFEQWTIVPLINSIIIIIITKFV